MKVRYVYTVVREMPLELLTQEDLAEEMESFRGISDEPGEYLYGGGGGAETVSVELQGSGGGNTWRKLTP